MLIGIAGEKKSGKETLASMFMHSGFARYGFADHLRVAASFIFEMPIATFKDSDKKDSPFKRKKWLGLVEEEYLISMDKNRIKRACNYFRTKYKTTKIHENLQPFKNKKFRTPREMLQFIGTDLIRTYLGNEFHIEYVFSDIMEQGYENVVLADARYSNERRNIKEIGGWNILIQRNTGMGKDMHESENDLGKPEDYDFIVDNNKTMKHLQQEVDRILILIINARSQAKTGY